MNFVSFAIIILLGFHCGMAQDPCKDVTSIYSTQRQIYVRKWQQPSKYIESYPNYFEIIPEISTALLSYSSIPGNILDSKISLKNINQASFEFTISTASQFMWLPLTYRFLVSVVQDIQFVESTLSEQQDTANAFFMLGYFSKRLFLKSSQIKVRRFISSISIQANNLENLGLKFQRSVGLTNQIGVHIYNLRNSKLNYLKVSTIIYKEDTSETKYFGLSLPIQDNQSSAQIPVQLSQIGNLYMIGIQSFQIERKSYYISLQLDLNGKYLQFQRPLNLKAVTLSNFIITQNCEKNCPPNIPFDSEINQCKCPSGHNYDPNLQQCISLCGQNQVYQNGQCNCEPPNQRNNQKDCILQETECQDNQYYSSSQKLCICNNGYQRNQSGQCQSICGENQVIQSGACVCAPYHHRIFGECIPITCVFGQYWSDIQKTCLKKCPKPNQAWNSKSCVCGYGYKYKDSAKKECVGICEEGYQYIEGQCQKI